MKSLFKRIGEATRWLRPYVTFVIGGLFFVVGVEYWWKADTEPWSITWILFAVGLLIMGRANSLRRER